MGDAVSKNSLRSRQSRDKQPFEEENDNSTAPHDIFIAMHTLGGITVFYCALADKQAWRLWLITPH